MSDDAPSASQPGPTAMRRVLARARDGKTLDPAEAAVLLHARGDQLDELLGYAARTRDAGLAAAGRPGVITYSKKVFIPLTRLCRDRCGYCTFVTVPGRLDSPYLPPDEVVAIAAQGAALGCKEALFTLGDRPEDRWHQAREWLDAHGYDDTLSYLRAMAIRVLEETGLLPHLNPGVLTWPDFQRLKPVAPSMGMMLETTASRLFTERGGPHYGSPDKDPAVRLRVLQDAGRSAVPFTTGILIGIGETLAERAESVFAIRQVAREYGGIQEVIVQNFRAKPDTAMRGAADAELDDLAATIAVTRLVLGPSARIQAPPNLIGEQYPLILAAGIDDWGGVSPLTPDHVNPERPWPQLDDLAAQTAAAGFELRERLTVYPGYQREPWLDPRLAAARGRAGRPGHRAGRGRRDAVRAALAGAGRWLGRRQRPHRPARDDRHHRPVRGPPGRLRRGVRRLGGDRCPDRPGRPCRPPSQPAPRAAAAARRRPRGAAPGRDRPGRADRRRRRWPCSARTGPSWTRWPRWPTGCARTRSGTTSRTSSTGTSTSPTSATPAAGSAPSPSGAPTPTRTRCPWRRSATGPRKHGRPARPRCACRAASTRTCPAPRTSTSPPRSGAAARTCTSTRSRRWRS